MPLARSGLITFALTLLAGWPASQSGAQSLPLNEPAIIAPQREDCLVEGQAASASRWTERACEEIDGVRRYHSDRRDYRMRSREVGNRSISVQARRRDATGAEQSAADAGVLTVQDQEPLVPRLEVMHPAEGSPLQVFARAYAASPPGWRPLEVWATAPGGLEQVGVTIGGQDFEMHRVDETRFLLGPDRGSDEVFLDQDWIPAYRLLADGEAIEAFYIEQRSGRTSFAGVAAERVANDADPVVELLAPPRLDAVKGDQAHVGIRVRDAGRNLTEVRAYWERAGCEIVPAAGAAGCAVVGGLRFAAPAQGNCDGDSICEDYAEREWLGTMSQDEFLLRIPYRAPYSAPASAGRLCLVAYDHDGVVGTAAPLCADQTLAPPLTDPYVSVTGPGFRVPAGERIPVAVDAEHLGFLESLDLILEKDGRELQRISHLIPDAATSYQASDYLRMPDNARVGEAYTIRAKVVGEGGRAGNGTSLVFAGDWGEREVLVDGTLRASDKLLYANVRVNANATLEIVDSSTRFNALTIRADGRVSIAGTCTVGAAPGACELSLHEALIVEEDGALEVQPHLQNVGDRRRRGAHGGDTSSNSGVAYDDFRRPRFPGSIYSGVQIATAPGGGALAVRSPLVRVDGLVSADGGVAGGVYGGGGGTLRLESTRFEGTGDLSVLGGSGVRYPGAGGRIAVLADTITREETRPAIRFELAGGRSNDSPPRPNGGAGTAYVFESGSTFGELYLSDQDSPSRTSTLGGIGRRAVASVESLGQNRYRVRAAAPRAAGDPLWNVPDDALWESGLVGQHLSLDAANRDAPIYRVIDNDAESVVIEADESVLSAAGREMIGVIRLDRIEVGDGVQLRTTDRIYAGNFEVRDVEALANVAEARSDRVIEIDAYVNDGQRDIQVADLIAGSFAVSGVGSVTQFYGEVSVTGLVMAGAGTRLDVIGNLAIGGLSIEGDADVHISEAFSSINDLVASDGAQFDARTLNVGGKLLLSGATRVKAERVIVSGETRIRDGAELRSTGVARFGDRVNVSNANLIASRIEVDNLAELIVEQRGVVSATESLRVSGSLLGASFAEIHAPELLAPFTQLDGETGRVELRTSRWLGDTGVLLDTRVRPYAGERGLGLSSARLTVALGRTAYVGAGASLDASNTAKVLQHPALYPACAIRESGRHAGAGTTDPNALTPGCSYGRYQQPVYAGADASTQSGGGSIKLDTESLVLHGAILANGEPATAQSGGAGGSVWLNAVNVLGRGKVEARGASAGGVASSGGRIALYADNWQRLTASLSSAGASDVRNGAAGTTFTSDSPGNPGVLSLQAATPSTRPVTRVGAVGRKPVTTVNLVATNRWRITSFRAGWNPSNALDGGLTGNPVSLDANDAAAPLFTIIANGEDWLELQSTADLTAYTGGTLLGQQVFEAVRIGSGARADFEGDRVIILDEASAAAFNWTTHNATPP